MDKQKQTVGNYMNTLTEDAQAVMAATSDVAGEKWAKHASISRPLSNVAKKSIARLEIKRSTAQRPLIRRFAGAHIRLSQLLLVLAHSSVF